MAKIPNAVIGVDLGRHAFKAVAMQRKAGGKLVLSHYGIRETVEPLDSAAAIQKEVRALLHAMGASAKHMVVAVSSADALVRIIEQPETPTQILRTAVRLNGQTLLNQDVRDYTLDCAQIPHSGPERPERCRYLVGGLPKNKVADLHEALGKERAALRAIQLAPVCTFNAFEYALPAVFENEAFMLVDIGHASSTIAVGAKKELVLVRVLEYGGSALVETLINAGAGGRREALALLEEGDDDALETARVSLSALTREVGSSIGFFEGRREESIGRIFVSGGAAGSRSVLQIMAEELHMPCMAWNPLERCELAISDTRRNDLGFDVVNLHAACGAAIEFLKQA